jgi:hypothetical protein
LVTVDEMVEARIMILFQILFEVAGDRWQSSRRLIQEIFNPASKQAGFVTSKLLRPYPAARIAEIKDCRASSATNSLCRSEEPGGGECQQRPRRRVAGGPRHRRSAGAADVVESTG